MKKYSWLLIVLLSLGVFAGGCGKGSASANAKAFDNANPEVKTMWEKALASAKSDDYVQAVMLYRALSTREDLTKEQNTALGNKLTEINEKMYAGAEKGDKKAQAAIDELKKIGRTR